jgi:hypothetical protein
MSLFFLLFQLLCFAQNRTNVWELSYQFLPGYPTSEMKYLNGYMDTSSVLRKMAFFVTNTSICDTGGNLIFYTNGLIIENRNYDTLENAVNFNPGWATDFYEYGGMGTCQGILILPDPGNHMRYYVFHESGESFFAYNTYQVQPLHLSYSVVDMNLDGGLGGVVDTLKNKYAIVDTLLWGGLSAVKHANGRDWWIIAHGFYTDKYYKILLTPNGLEAIYEQSIGSNLMYDVGVQATFSPDGSKYCISNHGGWFDYMEFDRCTGEFSNPITVFGLDSLGVWGSSFSPNSRFIYSSSQVNLYQYDTWDTNMVENAIHIAAWDSFVDPIYHIPLLFFMHQLGPDNKIYMSTFNGSLYLNVINYPDNLGLDCEFEPHSFLLPKYNVSIPSFPNYDLGILEGSPCDTIIDVPTGIALIKNYSYSVIPNPVSDWLNIVYDTDKVGLFELYDLYGKRIAAITLFPYFKNRLINMALVPSGVYLAVITQNDKQVFSERIVVTH